MINRIPEVKLILQNYLGKYNIDESVIDSMASELLRTLDAPERKKYGASVMTPEASASSDKVRRGEVKPSNGIKPTVF